LYEVISEKFKNMSGAKSKMIYKTVVGNSEEKRSLENYGVHGTN
jgi:hypothetical protein